MKNSNTIQKVGSWAFIVGVILAVLGGLVWQKNEVVLGILVVLGLVVGFLNVTGSETSPFLMASVSLVIVAFTGGTSVFNALGTIGPYIQSVLAAIQAFVMAATIIVALKAIYALASDE